MQLRKCNNIADLRWLARRKLPSPVFQFLEGGADDEVTLNINSACFDEFGLIPRCLVDVSEVDLSTRLLGLNIDLPLYLSPTGMSRLFHHEGELAAARAAEKFGTLYGLSTVSTSSIEAVAAATSGPKMFQIYVFRDRSLTREMVSRCRAMKYDALCLTVDTPVAGNRERDKVSGMTMPPKFGIRSLFSFVTSPVWSAYALRRPDFELANFSGNSIQPGDETSSLVEYMNSQLDPTVEWEDAEWLAREWGGPFVIKGIQSAEDARRALEIGATAVVVSNHGGRQLDGVTSSLDSLVRISEAVGGEIEIILDSGIRRGTHVIKALALGATACSIGRPYLYGLAAGGQAGVESALSMFRSELRRNMALMGCTSIGEIDRSCIAPRTYQQSRRRSTPSSTRD